jgi:CheY-like chemotaxis protein
MSPLWRRDCTESQAMRVLIVDDYPGVIELYDLALRARGFEVVGASTVAQAVTLVASERFDAAVLDVQLPDGSGVELVQRMRRMPRLAGARFVGISSYVGGEIARYFDAFLSKPVHPKRLAATLRRLLGGHDRVAA